MNSFFLPALSRAINAYLQLDQASKPRLQKLDGKVVTIEFLPFHFIFQCVFEKEAVRIEMGESLAAETRIRGTPLQLLGVVIAKENRHRFFADDLVMEGNAELGQQMITLFDEVEIDWEDKASRVIGDVPAYHLGRLANRVSAWLSDADNSLTQNVSEFIHEEGQWLPAREALQDFFNDVDSLRMDVDRMEAKIERLCANSTNHEDLT